MHLTTSTRVEQPKSAVFERVSDPASFAALNDSINVTPAGPDAWTLTADMNGSEVAADLVRTACDADGNVAYEASAQGLLITVSFAMTEVECETDLEVSLEFAGASMKGKMLMQGLKLMAPKMQSGLDKMVQKLARTA